jgi:hypothetical protein
MALFPENQMPLPGESYEDYLKRTLNWAERLHDKFESTDERLDFLNVTTLQVLAALNQIAAALGAGVPPTPGITQVLIPNKNTWRHGQRNVTVAGTPEPLAGSTSGTPDLDIPDGYPVTVIAKPGNNGTIYLGKSLAECQNATARFDGLLAGLAHSLRVKKLSEIWVDADNDGDGVSWSVEYDS